MRLVIRRSRSGRLFALLLSLCVLPAATNADAGAGPRSPRPDVSAATLALVDAGTLDPTTDRVWVTFTDKDISGEADLESRLDALAVALDPHARARRARTFRGRPVDVHDLPVATRYVDALTLAGAEIVRSSRWLNAVSVRCTPAVLRHVASLPFVHAITPVRGTSGPRLTRTPEPPAPGTERSQGDPFDYGASRDQLAEINVVEAHTTGLSGSGVRVASLDTGFEHTHPAFQNIVSDGRLLAQWDFINDDAETMNEAADDPSQHTHGTATWSTLGGFVEGEVVGPAFGATFLLAKTEDVTSETPIEEDNWIAAAEWADTNGADVISTSLGYNDWYTYADMDGETAPITIAADIAVGRGIVVCTSAGNQGTTEWFYITAPADGDSVLTVGAVDENNAVADFSSRGPTADGRIKPEVVARGAGTYCALPGPGYFFLNGTSLSCPLVAGAVALILEAHPTWDPGTVRAALLSTADNAATPNNDRGWGRIDVMAAISTPVVSAPTVSVPPPPSLVARPNPAGPSVRFRLDPPAGADALELTLFDVHGRAVRTWSLTGNRSEVDWDTRDDGGRPVANGVYVVRMNAGTWHTSRKIVLNR